jgi:hypothetical protein
MSDIEFENNNEINDNNMINLRDEEQNENNDKPIEPEIYQPINSEKINLPESNDNENKYENFKSKDIKEILKKSNLNKNNQKEKYIEEKLLEKYSKNMRNEIYNEEYKKIYNKIKSEISYKIREELLSKRQKEIELKKKKIEYNNKKKLEEYENTLYKNLKEEYEMSKIDIINLKTKEFEEKYRKEFLKNKDKIKRELITKYQIMTNKLMDELEESKRNLLEQQNKEKMRIKELNKIQGNYKEQENFQKQRNEQINTMIDNYKHFKMDNRRMDVYPTTNYRTNNNFMEKKRNNVPMKTRGKSNDIRKVKSNYSMIGNSEVNNSKYQFKKTPNKSGVNIKEINNRLKSKYV